MTVSFVEKEGFTPFGQKQFCQRTLCQHGLKLDSTTKRLVRTNILSDRCLLAKCLLSEWPLAERHGAKEETLRWIKMEADCELERLKYS
jgi:hypothetical protein